MYRINLYPEYQLARRAMRRRARVTALLTTLLGIELLLVGALLVSDVILRERIASLRNELPALTLRLEQNGRPCPQYELAREMVDLLAQRVVWAPKLAAVAERTGGGIGLTAVSGHAARRDGPPELTIEGACRDDSGLAAVTDYIESLRRDDRFRSDLPSVALGTLRGDAGAEFEVLCRPGEEQ